MRFMSAGSDGPPPLISFGTRNFAGNMELDFNFGAVSFKLN